MTIWEQPGSTEKIDKNEIWDTGHFSVRVKSNQDQVTVALSSDEFTVNKYLEQERISIYAATYSENTYSYLFDTEFFFMMSLLEDINKHSAKATFSLYDNPEYLSIIIVRNGVIHKAKFVL